MHVRMPRLVESQVGSVNEEWSPCIKILGLSCCYSMHTETVMLRAKLCFKWPPNLVKLHIFVRDGKGISVHKFVSVLKVGEDNIQWTVYYLGPGGFPDHET